MGEVESEGEDAVIMYECESMVVLALRRIYVRGWRTWCIGTVYDEEIRNKTKAAVKAFSLEWVLGWLFGAKD